MTTPEDQQKSQYKPITVDGLVRTSKGLRDGLFDEWDRLRRGESNPQAAQAVAKLACQIINSVKVEIEFNSHVHSLSSMNAEKPLDKTLQLGS